MQFNVRIRGVVKKREEEPRLAAIKREEKVAAAMERRETKGQERFDAWQKPDACLFVDGPVFVSICGALPRPDIEPL